MKRIALNFRLMTLFLALFVFVLAQGNLPKMTAAALNRGARVLSSAALGDYEGMARTKTPPTASVETNGAAPVNLNPSNPMTCPTISMANPATASGTVFSPFSQTFTQTQGIAPISFSLNSGTLPTGLTLATDGTLSGTPTQVGSFPITVKATDANNCVGIGAAYTLEIGKATPVITIENASEIIDEPSYPGQFYRVLPHLSASVPGAPIPIEVLLIDNGEEEYPALPFQNTYIFSQITGVRTITVTFPGNAYYLPGSESVTHTVLQIPTSLRILSVSRNNSASGQEITLRYEVDINIPLHDDGPIPANTGEVTITDGHDTYRFPATWLSVTFRLHTPGTRTINLIYSGDTTYESSYTTITHRVNEPLSVSQSFSPAVVPIGGLSTLSITITNPNPNVQEFVQLAHTFPANLVLASPLMASTTCGANLTAPLLGELKAGDSAFVIRFGSFPENGNCTVTLNVTPTAAGPFNNVIRSLSSYNGGQAAPASAILMTALPTTLSDITHSPDPSVTGQSYTVGFTLNAASGTPTGTVTVEDGTGGACSATLPVTSCSLTSTSNGVKTLTITYGGDDNFAGSTTTATHQVNKANTTATITAVTPDPSVFGQDYAVTAGVSVNSPGSGMPTGTITVTDGTNSCTIALPATSCNLPGASVGARTLTATYNGDADYNASPASAGTAHTVNKSETTTTIVSDDPDSSPVGRNVTVVFTVVATAPEAGAPTGNVTVSDGVSSCTGTVAAGSCVLVLTIPGNRTLTATYAGDANFNDSSDTTAHLAVAPPSITKAFSPPNAQVNVTTTLTLTITNPAANTVALTDVGFTDSFPGAGNLVVANPLTINNTCGGVLTNDADGILEANDTGIRLSGGTVNPNSTCTVSVNVTPKSLGPFINVTGKVTSANGGTGNTATATLESNTPPTITSNTITPKSGSKAAMTVIATVTDPDQPRNTLEVKIDGGTSATSNGVTVSLVGINNTTGEVTANVSSACGASNATFNLLVTDNKAATGTGELTVTVQPNTPPVLTYVNQTLTSGTTISFGPATGPSDNGTFSPIGLTSVTPNTGLTLGVNPATGAVTGTGTIAGSYTVVISLSDNCGLPTNASFTVNVTCPAITLNPATLPDAVVNMAYSQTIAAGPAGGNYSFALTNGLLPTGLTLNANGTFSGMPTNSGTFNFRVTATGFGGCTAFRDYVLMVSCPTVTVSPASLPGGTVGTAYSQTVSATPAGSYVYSVSSGALPLGLTLNASTGAITGTPTTSGSYHFMISAAAGTCSTSRTYTVVIDCPTMTLNPASQLPAGQVGVVYNQTFGVQPSGSYTFSITSGNLPGGVSLNPGTGVLSGIPTTAGSFTFTVRALAANGCAATQNYTLSITCPAVALTSLPNGSIGAAYNQTVSAAPAGGNFVYAVTEGSLPTGLSLNQSTGVLSGTLAAGGTFNFRITATGFGGCKGFRDYTMMVESGGGCPTISLPVLPNGVPGQLYTGMVTASPGGSYSYAVTAGSLPPGLTLYSINGMIFGYPTAGVYNFTIKATNTNNCAGSRSYTLMVGSGATSARAIGDFDGDGKTDLSVWRGEPGEWLTIHSGDGRMQTRFWGTSSSPYNDVMTPGDYDGDGLTDLAVFRRGAQAGQAGEWLIKGSQKGAIIVEKWGLATDTPVPGDYDGDGRTDVAVWRGKDGNWHILRSSDRQTQTVSWDTSKASYDDVPAPADYDGDGKTDIAIFRRSNGYWHIRQSSDDQLVTRHLGSGTDTPVAADYDGDGKADIAVRRDSDANWYIRRSSDGQTQILQWGASLLGDVPVPGDYDGDGKTDLAVWRESSGIWYVKRSSDGTEMSNAHGRSGDLPTAAKKRD